MSLTQVVPRLRALGVQIDTFGWYLWLHEEKVARGHSLGIDSCAIFYIGGSVHCQMPWNIHSIGRLLKAAACQPAGPQSRAAVAASAVEAESELDTYSGENTPGQLWKCYKSKRNEKDNEFTLRQKLTGLLEPSPSMSAEGQPSLLPAYLRLRQKPLNKKEWPVNAETGELHKGAHFPLFITTKNSSSRSAKAFAERRAKWPLEEARWANWGIGKTAVAAGASWWMKASSSSTPAFLEPKGADDLGADSSEATMDSVALGACAAGVTLTNVWLERTVDKYHAAPIDERPRPRPRSRHRSPHQCDWDAQWWNRSDWNWRGSNWWGKP